MMILPLQKVKFKQDMDIKTLEINVLYIVDAVVLFIMGNLSHGLRKYLSFLRLRFYGQNQITFLFGILKHCLKSFPNS